MKNIKRFVAGALFYVLEKPSKKVYKFFAGLDWNEVLK
jgi:hypothetical protein